jgi:hypothetical protein
LLNFEVGGRGAFVVCVCATTQKAEMFNKPNNELLRTFLKTVKCEYQLCHISVSLSVCPSVYTEQLSSHWKDFHEILYLNIFRQSVEKIQALLISNKNNEYVT